MALFIPILVVGTLFVAYVAERYIQWYARQPNPELEALIRN